MEQKTTRSFFPKNWSIQFKIFFSNTLLILFLSFLGYIALRDLSQVEQKTNKMSSEIIHSNETLREMLVKGLNHRRYEKDYFLNIGKPEKQAGYLKKFESTHKILDSLYLSLLTISKNTLDTNYLNLINNSKASYQRYYEGFLNIAELINKDSTMTPQMANTALMPIKNDIYAFESKLDSALAINTSNMDQFEIDFSATTKGMVLDIVKFLIFSGLCSFLFVFWVNRGIRKNISLVTKQLAQLATGNIRKLEYSPRDEFQVIIQSCNTFILRLQSIVSEIKAQVKNIDETEQRVNIESQKMQQQMNTLKNSILTQSQSAENIWQNSSNIANNSGQLLNAMDVLNSALNEMSSAIQEVSKNCTLETKASQVASDKAENTYNEMTLLEDSAKKISQVVKVIEEISGQTKLLALNASIEAASAGEAGKGFAVVSDEVKTLATQSANATSDISKLVKEVQLRTKETLISNQAIKTQISDVNNYAHSIAIAVEEQSATSNEISRNMESIKDRTTHIQSSIENTQNLIKELNQISSEMEVIANETQKGVDSSYQETHHLKQKTKALTESIKFFEF